MNCLLLTNYGSEFNFVEETVLSPVVKGDIGVIYLNT